MVDDMFTTLCEKKIDWFGVLHPKMMMVIFITFQNEHIILEKNYFLSKSDFTYNKAMQMCLLLFLATKMHDLMLLSITFDNHEDEVFLANV